METLEKLSDMQNSDDAKKIIERYIKPNFRGGKPKISDEDKALVAMARDKTAEIIENLSEQLFVDYTNYNVDDAVFGLHSRQFQIHAEHRDNERQSYINTVCG